jgi:hypothetical protein
MPKNKIKSKKFKRFFVDALALNLFVILTAFMVEVVFSGIAFHIFLQGRLIIIIPNMIVVTPYNITRKWIGFKIRKWKSDRLHQITRDTIVFIIYRVPLLFLVLVFLGAPTSNVIKSCVVATLISGFTGRPYGIFLDWMRRMFNVSEKTF